MKLTTKSEYSILALIHLARNEDKGFVKIEEICPIMSRGKDIVYCTDKCKAWVYVRTIFNLNTGEQEERWGCKFIDYDIIREGEYYG